MVLGVFRTRQEIRRIIYTTNAIESLNSTIRKYTKAKTVFPDDQAALKAVSGY
ncbi:MAG: transposase, partial [Bacteroidales bacterium]